MMLVAWDMAWDHCRLNVDPKNTCYKSANSKPQNGPLWRPKFAIWDSVQPYLPEISRRGRGESVSQLEHTVTLCDS